MEWDIESVLSKLNISFQSLGPKKKVNGVAALKRAKENELSFCWYDEKKGQTLISNSKAGVILCKNTMKDIAHTNKSMQILLLDNPRLAFIHIMNYMSQNKRLVGISSSAIISKNSRIGKNCYIGNYAVIGNNCEIADNTIIGERVNIVQNCFIGSNCIIQPGVTIGADGFAFERYSNGTLERFPHIGRVILEDNVEVSANSSIARGSLSDTLIGEGTKIDALVHVAHNVTIGKNCELTAGTVVGGSTNIGDMCWMGLNCTLKDNIKVGKNSIIAAGAVVIHDISDGDVVAGVPAKSIKSNLSPEILFLMAGQESLDGHN